MNLEAIIQVYKIIFNNKIKKLVQSMAFMAAIYATMKGNKGIIREQDLYHSSIDEKVGQFAYRECYA